MSRARSLAYAVLSVVCFAALSGCGVQAPPPPSGPGQLTLSSLHADGTPMELRDGQDVTLVEGAQGGFHVWMKFRSHDIPAGATTVERTAHRLSDDKLVLRSMTTMNVGPLDPAGDWEPIDPLPMFMCPSPVGLSVVEQPIVFRIALSDGAGKQLAASEVTLVPHCPAAQSEFCQRICTG